MISTSSFRQCMRLYYLESHFTLEGIEARTLFGVFTAVDCLRRAKVYLADAESALKREQKARR